MAARLPSWSADERIAAAGLVAAGAAGALAPWVGIAPWWPLCAVAAVLVAVSWTRERRRRGSPSRPGCACWSRR